MLPVDLYRRNAASASGERAQRTGWCLPPVMVLGAAMLLLPAISQATTVQPAPVPTSAPRSGGVAGPPDGGIPPAPIDRGGRQIPPPVIVTPPPTGPAPFPLPSRPTLAPAPSAAPTATPAPTSRAPAAGQIQPRDRAPSVAGQASRARAVPPGPTPPGPTPPGPTPPGPTPDGNTVLPVPIDPALIPDDGRNTGPPQDAIPADPAADMPGTQAATAGDGLSQWWPWIAGGGVILALLIGWLLGRQRRHPAATGADQGIAAERAPDGGRSIQPSRTAAKVSPPKTITVKPAPKPVVPASSTPRRDFAPRLGIALTPLAVSTTLVNMRLRYAIDVINLSDSAISGGKCRVQLLSGPQAAEAVIRSWFGSDSAHAVLDIPALAHGGSAQMTGEIAVPLGGLHPITVEGRMLVVPVIGLVAQFTHATGLGQVARAFVIGRDPGGPGDKLAPFRLDRGPANFTPLGARDTGIADSA